MLRVCYETQLHIIKNLIARGHGACDPLFGSARLVLGNFPGMELVKQQTAR